jgi:hypothetical protein
MDNETPRDKTKHTLKALLEDLDRDGFKLTGALKTLVLSGRKEGRLRSQGLGIPFTTQRVLSAIPCMRNNWEECCLPVQPVRR